MRKTFVNFRHLHLKIRSMPLFFIYFLQKIYYFIFNRELLGFLYEKPPCPTRRRSASSSRTVTSR